ncbi:thiopeptide-type bacteriocin biosynthesis domain-containing protein [Lentzea xinjiangensis]|uniref:Thiopeptide-type bacteriocin biosynthesis domain-containing protein n=1 Tax=Lentzea xinjiangensis TaxID=402600 RepID=A0A1H9W3P6_9PSEU|nr:thiopeptide-type bacteriocin biosynthesis domain-containing protein [Lentzea xinjiangensis]
MQTTLWTQRNLTFPGASAEERERHAVAHLSQALTELRERGLTLRWWFVRKGAWRIRYQLTDSATDLRERGLTTRWPVRKDIWRFLHSITGSAIGFLHDPVHPALTAGLPWTRDIYEPETHAFGGPESMALAHELFCRDSSFLLPYLATDPADRRERSLVLFTALMRAAGLDTNEQGDVWAQVAQYRPAASTESVDPHTWAAFTADVGHLLRGTPRAGTVDPNWLVAFTHTGNSLKSLREQGLLTRGIRAIVTLHVIFAWNRLGLTAPTQASLATAAKEAIFGAAPGTNAVLT